MDFVSVLLPIKNEEKNIENCLKQIFNQTYDHKKMELIILDGGSTDNTIAIIDNYFKDKDFRVKVLVDNNSQRSSAMNLGIKSATGDIVLRLDARTYIDENYVSACVKTIKLTNADNVGGLQKPISIDESKFTQNAICLAMSNRFGVGNAQFRLGRQSGEVDSVYLGCFKKSIFDKVGYFDDTSSVISEDSDINYRIRKSGGKVFLNTDITAYYLPRERFIDLIRLYFRYGGARAGFMLKWKAFTASRQLLPPLFLLSLLALTIMGLVYSPFYKMLFLLLCVYLSVNAIVSIKLAIKQRNIHLFPRLFCIFPMMHFSWAVGFWVRILQPKNAPFWGY